MALADTLVDDYDVVELLDRLVASCMEFLPVNAAGLLLVDAQGALRLVASSDEDAGMLELLQIQHDQGPCVDSLRTGRPVNAVDLAEDGRWPRFTSRALSLGFRSVHAVPMRLRSEQIGGLNLFGATPMALDEDQAPVAQAMADIATIGILQQRSLHRASVLAEQLQRALASRVVIEQAKGLLAGTGHLDMRTAYAVLRFYARDHNLRVGVVATGLVDGSLPLPVVLGAGRRSADPPSPPE